LFFTLPAKVLLILVALVGNAAEHSTAVLVALKNKMDLAYGIAVESSLQIALLDAPLLVFASYLFGTPLDLIFTPFEVAAVTISVLIVGFVAMDGESNWMEGVMLVGVYLMLAIAFFCRLDRMKTLASRSYLSTVLFSSSLTISDAMGHMLFTRLYHVMTSVAEFFCSASASSFTSLFCLLELSCLCRYRRFPSA
jgi:hypothetical protein